MSVEVEDPRQTGQPRRDEGTSAPRAAGTGVGPVAVCLRYGGDRRMTSAGSTNACKGGARKRGAVFRGRASLLLLWLVVLLLAGGSVSSAQPGTQGPGPGTAPSLPASARLTATHTLKHHVEKRGTYTITVESFEYDNTDGGYSTLRIYDAVNVLDHYEVAHTPLAYGSPPIVGKAKNQEFLFVEYRLDYDHKNPGLLGVYVIPEAALRAHLRLGGSAATRLGDIVGDFDGDGKLEVLNLEILEPGTRQPLPGASADLGVRSIYRVVSGPSPSWALHFERVKGRAFEKQFLSHARWLIEEAYPKLLKRKQLRAAESVVMSWLATVESTSNAERIREALARLEALPHPDPGRKREILGLLVRDGYPLLGQES